MKGNAIVPSPEIRATAARSSSIAGTEISTTSPGPIGKSDIDFSCDLACQRRTSLSRSSFCSLAALLTAGSFVGPAVETVLLSSTALPLIAEQPLEHRSSDQMSRDERIRFIPLSALALRSGL